MAEFLFFLEREHLLSKIPIDQTVGFRRSKKESCSTRRGLRMGTDLVEFRQLQEVGSFPNCVNPCLRTM